jgi:hypothetical protein
VFIIESEATGADSQHSRIALVLRREVSRWALASRLAVVSAKVGKGFEIRHQTPGQPHQLDVALCFPLKAPGRMDVIEITVDVDFSMTAG